jgi:hypothetical protein
MDKKLRITEASLLFVLQNSPKVPVDSAIPFVLDTRGRDIERVIAAGTSPNALPDWINSCKELPGTGRGYMIFTYAPGVQSVDCVYKEQRSTLSIRGVKYHNLGAFVDRGGFMGMFDALDAEPAEGPSVTYRATMGINVGVPWDRDSIAEVITNNPEISQVAAVSEEASTLGSRSLFSVSVMMPHSGVCAKATIRHDDLDMEVAVVTMSKLPSTDASEYVADLMETVFAECYGQGCALRDQRGHHGSSEIVHLRSELPELFINNYTRECPVLPVMLSEEQAAIAERTKRVIRYPVGSSYCRPYTAPDGYFVGLKKNRLGNRGTFPYLVTCYLQDHMLKRGSETYNYYEVGDGAIKKKSKPSRPIPRAISNGVQVAGYTRKRAPSFVGAIEASTGTSIDTASLPWCPQVVRQDMCNAQDSTIMGAIRSGSCGPSAYRYFEELLGVSIHAVATDSGVFVFSPEARHSRDTYIWEPPYPVHVVIFETVKRAYGKARYAYDFLAKGSTATFDSSDPIVSLVMSAKSRNSARPQEVCDAAEQLIDDMGRCRMVVTRSGECVETLTRPLTVRVMPDPVCFFDSHIYKMNVIRHEMGLGITHLYKRSTKDLMYFPNRASFEHWMRVASRQDGDLRRC